MKGNLKNNNYSKLKENITSYGFPLITGIILTLSEIFGKGYLRKILIGGLATLFVCAFLYLAVRFLEGREERWIKNNENYEILKRKTERNEIELKYLKQEISTNKKINKIEKYIGYILGRLKK